MNARVLCWAAVGMGLHAVAVLGQPIGGGGYLELDGVDDVVTAEGDYLSQTLTVEAWVRPASLHPLYTAGVVTYGSRDTSSFDFGIGPADDTRLRFFINYNQGQQTIVGTRPIVMDVWQHIAVTYDGETARLYVDGQLDAEKVLGGAILPSGPGALLAIGDDYPGASEFVGGSFDEVRVWEVVRSESEIAEYMSVPLVGDELGLLAYYDLDELGSQVVVDHAPAGSHGRLGLSLSRGEDDPVREVYVPSRRRRLSLGSSGELEVAPIVGDIASQIAQINAGPPVSGWSPVVFRHADLHEREAFACGENLDLPYVDSESFLVGADEVTLDNCRSAFYRLSFTMPKAVENTAVFGAANADDLGVVFVNGEPVSLLLTMDDVVNLGEDRAFNGRRLLGWPTADPFIADGVGGLVGGGLNSITFAVCSDAGEFEPAGLEFELVVAYDCLADWNADGEQNTADFTAYFNVWVARDLVADIDGDGRVTTLDLLLWLNSWTFGCPE